MLRFEFFDNISRMLCKKWAKEILLILQPGPKRFSQLKKNLPGCSVKVLSSVLHYLEKHRLIVRIQHNTMPVTVVYDLTISGQKVIKSLAEYQKTIAHHVILHPSIYKLNEEEVQKIKVFIMYR